MTDHQQWQADREQERRVRDAEFHKHHPEFRLLGDLHPVLRQAFVPLVAPQTNEGEQA